MDNNLEIERKFFISKNNPHFEEIIKSLPYIVEERYYLYREDGTELRITKLLKDEETVFYNFDRMALQQKAGEKAFIVRTKERLRISAKEYEVLLSLLQLQTPNVKPIIRWSYQVGEKTKFELKVYKDRFEGLIRAEIEFESEEESENYTPPDWFGKEITNSPVGIDTLLPDLSNEEFSKIIDSFLSN